MSPCLNNKINQHNIKKYIIRFFAPAMFFLLALIPALVIFSHLPQPLQAMFPEYTGEFAAEKTENRERLTPPFFFMAENGLFDARFILEYSESLRLSPEQQKKIQDIMLDHEGFRLRNSADIKIRELRFATQLRGGDTDRTAVERYIREISAEKTKLIIHYTLYLLDVRDQLTPEQQKKLKELHKKFIAKFRGKKSER